MSTGTHQLDSAFKDTLRSFSDEYPEVNYKTSFSGKSFAFSIEKQSEEGFSIYIEFADDELIFHCGHFHQHIDKPKEMSAGDYVNHVFGMVYDYLSSDVRLREKRSNGKPYRWTVEIKDGDEWKEEHTNGLIFYNYFGTKSERIYQNSILPPRMNGGRRGC